MAINQSIKQLSDKIINQIAAGEVVERPASVIKELVENSLDANATRIEINFEQGGKSFIQVRDNGDGIKKEELILAISRHCTSKLTDDITDIRSLGFRGEALPSIGSIAKLKIISKQKNHDGAAIYVEGGKISGPKPSPANNGTLIEVRDLFFATPARLKFLKSERAEASAISEIIKRIAIAYPEIYFSLHHKQKQILQYLPQNSDDGDLQRLSDILGQDFAQNCYYFNFKENNIQISGYSSTPAYNCGAALWQFAYINKRPIRDKFVLHAIRSAYFDVIPKGRYPYIALFISMDPQDVDVNVHPAKADIRFRDPQYMHRAIRRAIKSGLEQNIISQYRPNNNAHNKILYGSSNQRALRNLGTELWPRIRLTSPSALPTAPSPAYDHNLAKETNRALAQEMRPDSLNDSHNSHSSLSSGDKAIAPLLTAAPLARDNGFSTETAHNFTPPYEQDIEQQGEKQEKQLEAFPLGAACAQFHKNYILAQTATGIVIVDQHAAHERIIYEKLKAALYGKALARQMLLMPQIIDLSKEEADALLEYQKELEQFGLVIEGFGPQTVLIREIPAILGDCEITPLIKDLSQEILEHATIEGIKHHIDHIAATMACYGSIRSGRLLKIAEMNSLLRDMEQLANAGTCNHGRPTYITLSLSDIEKLFKRR